MISDTTSSGGGPIIALPAEIAHLWRGTLPPIDIIVPEGWTWGMSSEIICDYDRACDNVQDTYNFGYDVFGYLEVASSKALVFSTEQIIGFLSTERGGVIVGNFYEEHPSHKLLEMVPSEAWQPYPHTLTLSDGRLFIFDSAYEGYSRPDEIRAFNHVVVAQLASGTYKIFHFNTDESIGFVKLEKI